MKRINLCSPQSLWGFVAVGATLLGFGAMLALMSHSTWPFFVMLMFFVVFVSPFAWAAALSHGRFLELDDASIALNSKGTEVWRVAWKDLVGISVGPAFSHSLIDRNDRSYSFPSTHMEFKSMDALYLRLPLDGFIQFQPNKQRSPWIGRCEIIVGLLLTFWGCWGYLGYRSVSRQFEQTLDPALDQNLRHWPLGVQALGIILGCTLLLLGWIYGLGNGRPPTDGRISLEKCFDRSSLLSRIRAGQLSPTYNSGTVYVSKPRIEKYMRFEQIVCAVASIAFGAMFVVCIVESFQPRSGFLAVLGCGFLFFVSIGALGLWFSKLEWQTRAWKVKVFGEKITAISPDGGEFEVARKDVLGHPYLWIVGAGRKLTIDPQHFVAASEGK